MKAIGAMKRANAPKKKKVSEAGGEKSDAAKTDRLRISAFQNFWKGVNENIVILRALTPRQKIDASVSLLKDDALRKLPPNSLLIHPSDPLKVGWDFFIGIVIFYSIITVPYKIGFNTPSTYAEDVLEYTIALLFLFDIILSFNAAYVSAKTDKLVVDRGVIIKTYMKFWFWIDTVSTIPFELVTHSANASSIRLVKVLRLIRLMKLFRIIKLSKFAKRFDDIHINPSILNVIKLTIQILFVAHLIACFWFYITTETITGYVAEPGTPEDEMPVSWVTATGLTYVDTGDQYVSAFYWTVTTMLSIGYGDILPTNTSERLYAMSVMMIGGVLFGAVIAQVTKFIESRNPQAKAFKARIDEVKAYLTEKSPSEMKLRKEVIGAYNYYLMRKSTFAESGIFDDLPKGMLIKLVYTIYDKEIQEVSAFSHFNSRFVVSIVINAQPFQARENDIVAQEFDVAEELVFIASGLVRLTLRRGVAETILVGYAGDGDYFGDFEYTKKSARVANYTACSSCSFLAVDYEILEQLEGDHGDAHEDFMVNLKNRMEHFEFLKKLPCSKKNADDVYYEFSKILYNGEIHDSTESHMNQKENNNFSHNVKFRCLIADPITHKIILHELTAKEIINMNLIHPKFSEKVFWDMFIGVLIVWSVLSAPVQIAFATNADPAVDWFLTFSFFIDMLLAFRTAYLSEEDDAYVVYPEMIIHNYLHTWFPIDFVSTVPFDAFVSLFIKGTTNLSAIKLVKAVRLLRLMRLLRLSKLRSYLARLEDAFGIPPAIFNILSMYIQVLFIAHMVACLWWGCCALMTKNTWYDNVMFTGNVGEMDPTTQYITCLYWTLTTLATVGYGDLVPINTSERILCVFVMIVGASVFGYIVANVSALMGQMDQANSRVVERVSEVTEYLNEKNCPKGLSDSIIKHFRHMFNQKSAFDEESILKRLPRRLRNRLLLSQRGEIMSHIPIFKFIHNTSVAMYVYGLLDPLYFEVKQFILKEGELAHDVSFIIAGTAHIFRKVRVNKQVRKGGLSRAGSLKGASRKGPKRQGSVIGLQVKKVQSPADIPTITARVSQLIQAKVGDSNDSQSLQVLPNGDKVKGIRAAGSTGPWAEYHTLKMEHRERGRDFLGELHQGSFVGHMALLKNTRHEASVVAYRAVSMYVLSRADIGKTTREHQHVSMFLQDALARAIRKLQDEVGKEHIKLTRSEYLYNLRKGHLAKKDETREINAKLSTKRNSTGSAPSSYNPSSPLPGLPGLPGLQGAFSPAQARDRASTFTQGVNSVLNTLSKKNSEGENSPVMNAWTAQPEAEAEAPPAPEVMKMTPEVMKMTNADNSANGMVSAFTAEDEEKSKTDKKVPMSPSEMVISQEVKKKYAVNDPAKIVPSNSNDNPPVTPTKDQSGSASSAGSQGSAPAQRKSGISSPIFNRTTIVKTLPTLFNDSNLMYDSDDDEQEWFQHARVAKFKRINSCPAFETILSKLDWQDDNKDTKGVIAAVLNENADGKEVDRLALRAQTVAYDVKVQQELEAQKKRALNYNQSHGVDHHDRIGRTGSASAKSVANSGKNSSNISRANSSKERDSVNPNPSDISPRGFLSLDANKAVDATMEQMLSGRLSGINSPMFVQSGSPMFLSPAPGAEGGFSPVPSGILKTHTKKDRKELPQNRKKIERCNSFPSLAVDELKHIALSHAII